MLAQRDDPGYHGWKLGLVEQVLLDVVHRPARRFALGAQPGASSGIGLITERWASSLDELGRRG